MHFKEQWQHNSLKNSNQVNATFSFPQKKIVLCCLNDKLFYCFYFICGHLYMGGKINYLRRNAFVK